MSKNGYGPVLANDYGDISSSIRYRYSTVYDAATNSSTITIIPQFQCGTNLGSDIRMHAYQKNSGYMPNAGIRVDDETLWEFEGGFSGERHLNCSSSNWADMYANNGDTFSFSRTHNNNGDVSFFAGIVGAAEGYSIVPNAPQSVYDWPHGKEISVHEDRTLSVTYNANGGKSAPAATYFYGSTENIKLASTTPTRTGYTFSGWSTNSGGTGTSYSAGQNIGTRTSSLTLYAKWTPNTYVISYDANGGSNAPASQTTTYGTPLTLTTAVPTWAGHTFLGWANSSEATSARYQPGGTYTLNSTRTLYAVWKLDEYSLTTSISQTGITVNILRTSSPVGGAAQGLLYNGDKLYLNDVVKVSWSIASGYAADTLEINGDDVRSLSPPQKTITVTRDMTVTMLVGSGAVVYIGNQPYQVFIGNGTSWVQYQAYIGNGTTWDAY